MEISKITDFGDLKDDETIQNKLQNFHSSVEKIGKLLDIAFSNDLYEKMTVKEKVDYDLFINYALNTLFWLYLRCKGEDPNSNDIKHQLTRIKEYMMKAKQAHERNTIKPTIDKGAAARFIKHGVNYKKDADREPPNKKIKFS